MNVIQNTTELSLYMCERHIQKDGIAVDCTCGRGRDTLWLAQRCRKVYAFDVQGEALTSTRQLLQENGIDSCCGEMDAGVVLINDSHEHIKKYVGESPWVIMFNLGFLPGGDKNITTKAESTMRALNSSLELLKVNGLLCITIYPGHEEGMSEKVEVLKWAEELDRRIFHCVYANMINQTETAPQIVWITKKR